MTNLKIKQFWPKKNETRENDFWKKNVYHAFYNGIQWKPDLNRTSFVDFRPFFESSHFSDIFGNPNAAKSKIVRALFSENLVWRT